ncbi:bacteriochlorophyll 4-vinyl reductase [Novosphingobium sp.]|uniref:bacteriochlorophyll 4-vinyl reductase n=1 Tax=Novosphingobium sp. TaxID=1874826 RepID=UPI001DCC6F78|nr:bacteriochlorophyll 4-vinyl reductase [Novosphingobium sp.]MBX9662329.1 bacteriochlorophyll 4-vinyl reductase [Novosphingobium sp.]
MSVLAGKVGPNAIIQLADVLADRLGLEERAAALRAAGLAHYLARDPERMTDEREAAALHLVVQARQPRDWDELSWEAGERTAEYLLAHRIPKGAQWLLRRLPAAWSALLLLRSIKAHAWTFAGSGDFSARLERGVVVISIAANPIAMPGCPWHRGVFTRLFRELVSPHVLVRHEHCCAQGAPACKFVIGWI